MCISIFFIALFAYWQGVTGPLSFDDGPNLDGLKNIRTLADAIVFISSGSAGPIGRPLALASFAAQAYAWPSAPDVFLWVNICIHLINGCLVLWLFLLIGRSLGIEERAFLRRSLMAAGIWLLSPLLVSSSLLIIQRMTTLSATFLLLALIGYLKARLGIRRSPWRAMGLMSLSLAGMGALSILCKESGVLLPVYVFALEGALLSGTSPLPKGRVWCAWKVAVFVLPLFFFTYELAKVLPYPDGVTLYRGFSGSERLCTEAVILFKYLYLAFLPQASQFGIFHDDQTVYRSALDPHVLAAVIGWAVIVVSAFVFRKRCAWWSFAVFWFLGGHLIESTSIPLELYFEHRNYLPLLGPYLAAVVLVADFKLIDSRARALLAGAYVLLMALVLFDTTSMWGMPRVSAELQAMNHPDSLRAAQNLNAWMQRYGDLEGAAKVLDNFAEKHPIKGDASIQSLVFACVAFPEEDHRVQVSRAFSFGSETQFRLAVGDSLEILYKSLLKKGCRDFDTGLLQQLIARLLTNPQVAAMPTVRHNLNFLMARIEVDENRLAESMTFFDRAISASWTFSTVEFASIVAKDIGRRDLMRKWLREGETRRPKNPMRQKSWNERMDNLRLFLNT